MALFHSSLPENNFTSLFRLLDDYDDHRATRGGQSSHPGASLRTFQPKFDVHEEKDAYHLNGELPGIDQKDINIDFTDHQTLTVRGRVERHYTTGNDDNGSAQSSTAQGSNAGHNPTVEDDPEEGGEKSDKQVATTTAEKKKHAAKPHFKYWATERSIGEFHRSFTFPANVDQDKVKASLKNGILNVVIPKATAPQARRIQIE